MTGATECKKLQPHMLWPVQDRISETGAAVSRRGPKDGAQLYEAIHRSIVTGLLGQIAQRKERNIYKTARQSRFDDFSWLRFVPSRAVIGEEEPTSERTKPTVKIGELKRPEWIVAGEIVETSRLYARTMAGVEADSIPELAGVSRKVTFENPHSDSKVGKVLARERVILNGLELTNRSVFSGDVNSDEATKIFIPPPSSKMTSTRSTVSSITTASFVKRSRHCSLGCAIVICSISIGRYLNSIKAHPKRLIGVRVNRFIDDRSRKDPDFLCAKRRIIGPSDLRIDMEDFPDALQVGIQKLPIRYAYAPAKDITVSQ